MKDKSFLKIYPQTWIQIALLLGFCLVLYFINLGRWDLWNPDEPRYAQVAREMVQGGDWVLMHFNGKVYGHKPPLFFWLIALSSYLWQGFSSFSVRFPSAFFGTLTVLLTFLFGRFLYSSRTGFLSGFILATSVEFAYLATRADIDATLTFFTTASLFCFFCWDRYRQEDKEKQGTVKGLTLYGFYVGMALATLAKGPVGFILPFSVSLIYLLIQKDWKGFKKMKLLSGLLLLLVVVLAWYLPAVWKGGKNYLSETLLTHTIDRYASGWAKTQPIYYYLYNFPLEFLPWFFFMPAAMVYGYSKEGEGKKKEFLFLLIWFAAIFLFFSLSKGKRGLYLLPLYPAVSLMAGKLWEDLISSLADPLRREWITFPLYGLMGLTFVGGIVVPWVVSIKFPSFFPYSLPMAILLVGGSLAMFVLHRFKNYGAIFFLIIGMMAGGFFYASRVIFPLVNPLKSARFISQEIRSRIQPGERLGIYGDIGTPPYNFYTGIVPILELEKKEDLFQFLQSSERIFCLLKFRDFNSLQAMEGWPRVHLIARRAVGGNDVVLISNQ